MADIPVSVRKPRRKNGRPDRTRTLIVHMYDVGFGDCFLLRIPKPDGKTSKVLIDCGSIKKGISGRSMDEVVRQVIEDCRDFPDEPARIDVIVATHRHKDHISGFANPSWNEVEVGEVWMPWTEKPDEPRAIKLRAMHARLSEQLEKRLRAKLAVAIDPAHKLKLDSALELVLNAKSNESAMRTLQRGFAGKPVRRYLPSSNASGSQIRSNKLPGVDIHVLGPSLNEDVMFELNPPKGQSYLKFLETGHSNEAGKPQPFGREWMMEPNVYQMEYWDLASILDDEDKEKIRGASEGIDEAVAVTLDRALNGTSLVLVFQIGEATLCFPGDAQWGTWRLVLENQETRKLLEATTFYKVGHHGSHNATPVEFVEEVMGKNVQAMISVNPTGNWPLIPKGELLTALAGKEGCKIARSDLPTQAKADGFHLGKNGFIEALIPY